MGRDKGWVSSGRLGRWSELLAVPFGHTSLRTGGNHIQLALGTALPSLYNITQTWLFRLSDGKENNPKIIPSVLVSTATKQALYWALFSMPALLRSHINLACYYYYSHFIEKRNWNSETWVSALKFQLLSPSLPNSLQQALENVKGKTKFWHALLFYYSKTLVSFIESPTIINTHSQ